MGSLATLRKKIEAEQKKIRREEYRIRRENQMKMLKQKYYGLKFKKYKTTGTMLKNIGGGVVRYTRILGDKGSDFEKKLNRGIRNSLG